MEQITSRKSPPDSGVYFVECSGYVKIGIAWTVRQRFIALQGSNPVPLIPLGFIPIMDTGDQMALERKLHKRFAADRVRGEWFTLTKQIRRYIKKHASPWPWPVRPRVYGGAPREDYGSTLPPLQIRQPGHQRQTHGARDQASSGMSQPSMLFPMDHTRTG